MNKNNGILFLDISKVEGANCSQQRIQIRTSLYVIDINLKRLQKILLTDYLLNAMLNAQQEKIAIVNNY